MNKAKKKSKVKIQHTYDILPEFMGIHIYIYTHGRTREKMKKKEDKKNPSRKWRV